MADASRGRWLVVLAFVTAATCLTLAGTAPLGSAHGGNFAVILLADSQGAETVPQRFEIRYTTAAPDELGDGGGAVGADTVDVELVLSVGGDRAASRQVEVPFQDSGEIVVWYTPTSPGRNRVTLTATFSAGGVEKTVSSNRTIEVAPTGSEAAMAACMNYAVGDVMPPYALNCHLRNEGVAGLLPGLFRSPPLVGLLTGLFAGIGAVLVGRRRDVEVVAPPP